MKIIRTTIVIIISIGLVILLQKYFGAAKMPSQSHMGGDSTVVTAKVAKQHFSDRIEAIGTAYANEAISITSTVTERISKIFFENGATVKKGDMLVQLESTEEQAQLDEARINLAEQKREFARVKSLRDKKVVAEQAFDTQKSAVELAEARLAATQAQLQDRSITAPFPGVLGIRTVSPGALVSPGTVITTLDDLNIIKAEFAIPETFLPDLATGQEIEASSISWPDLKFQGTVSSIDSRIDAVTRAVRVQAKIPNTEMKLRAGMLLTIELIGHPRDEIGIPEKAVLAYAEKQYVFVVNKDLTVTRREIRPGIRNAGVVEILNGLEPGEVIVTEGLMSLRDGAKVKTVDSSDASSVSAETTKNKQE